MAFQDYGIPMETVTVSKFLWLFLAASDGNWLGLVAYLRKDHIRCESFSIVMGREVADLLTSGTFYKALVQATLLFYSENWVMTPRIGMTLRGFHHRVACHLAGMHPKQDMSGR